MILEAIYLLESEIGGLKPFIFASVLNSNKPSLRALYKIGFHPASSHELAFYSRYQIQRSDSELLLFKI